METGITMPPTKDQMIVTFNAVTAVADAIRDLGEVPSGHLYAMLMSRTRR